MANQEIREYLVERRSPKLRLVPVGNSFDHGQINRIVAALERYSEDVSAVLDRMDRPAESPRPGVQIAIAIETLKRGQALHIVGYGDIGERKSIPIVERADGTDLAKLPADGVAMNATDADSGLVAMLVRGVLWPFDTLNTSFVWSTNDLLYVENSGLLSPDHHVSEYRVPIGRVLEAGSESGSLWIDAQGKEPASIYSQEVHLRVLQGQVNPVPGGVPVAVPDPAGLIYGMALLPGGANSGLVWYDFMPSGTAHQVGATTLPVKVHAFISAGPGGTGGGTFEVDCLVEQMTLAGGPAVPTAVRASLGVLHPVDVANSIQKVTWTFNPMGVRMLYGLEIARYPVNPGDTAPGVMVLYGVFVETPVIVT